MFERQKLTFVSRDLFEKAKANLQRISQTKKPSVTIPDKMTRPQFIRALRSEIQAAFKRGYDVDDIVRLVSELGVSMDLVTFRRCWRQARKVRSPHAASQPDDNTRQRKQLSDAVGAHKDND